MSEFFNAPYATANRTILRSALRNRKLADQLIKQIHDLQLYSAANGGTITKWVMPSDIVPSSDSPFVIDAAKIRSQMTMALNSEYLASFMLNVIRELQILAGITPIMNSYVTYKKSPFNEISLQKLIIATLANRKLGKLLQEAIYELQIQMSLYTTATLTATADSAGAAGNQTVTADGVQDFDTLIGAGWTSSAGGTEIPKLGTVIVFAGGADAVKAHLLSQGVTYTAKTTGTGGNSYSVEVIDSGVGGLAYTELAGALTIDLGGDVVTAAQVVTLIGTTTPSAFVDVALTTAGPVVVHAIQSLASGLAATTAAFTGVEPVIQVPATVLTQPLFV